MIYDILYIIYYILYIIYYRLYILVITYVYIIVYCTLYIYISWMDSPQLGKLHSQALSERPGAGQNENL